MQAAPHHVMQRLDCTAACSASASCSTLTASVSRAYVAALPLAANASLYFLQKELQAAGSRLRSLDQELQDARGKLQGVTTELQQVRKAAAEAPDALHEQRSRYVQGMVHGCVKPSNFAVICRLVWQSKRPERL